MLFILSILETEEEKLKMADIYENYRQRMYYVALSIVKNEMNAEDMVHSAFFRLIWNLDSLEDIHSQKSASYIITAVKWCCYDFLKRNRKIIFSSLDELEIEIPDLGAFDAIDKLHENSPNSQLMKNLLVLQKKNYDQYSVIALLFNGYTEREIASIMNLKEATVRKKIERARKFLAKGITINKKGIVVYE